MDSDASDATLVAAARAKDREAFAALVARHRPLLLALCIRVLRSRDAAEDGCVRQRPRCRQSQ